MLPGQLYKGLVIILLFFFFEGVLAIKYQQFILSKSLTHHIMFL